MKHEVRIAEARESMSAKGQQRAAIALRPLRIYPNNALHSQVWEALVTTEKLSVGKALDKLRKADPPKSKQAQFEEDDETLRREIRELQAMRRRYLPPSKG